MQSELTYFDCFAAIGRRAGKDPKAPWTTEHLLSEMERCRIHGALIFAHQARETHPQVGNPIVNEICHANERLVPCWVVLPHHTSEFPHPDHTMERDRVKLPASCTNAPSALSVSSPRLFAIVDCSIVAWEFRPRRTPPASFPSLPTIVHPRITAVLT